jgi:anti-sigma regulatory factor (Ser/Thr protein kinase)
MGEPTAAFGPGEPAEFVHQVWPAHSRQLAPMRAEVRRWLAPLALTGDAKDDLVLAVSEAAANCVEHAYIPATADDTVELTFWTEPQAVCIEVVDHGVWQTPPDQPTGRGRGIQLMQRLMALVLIHYDTRGTRVLLRHPRPCRRRRVTRRVPPQGRRNG